MTLKRVAVYGAGGLGKEVRGLLRQFKDVQFAGYLDDFKKTDALAAAFDDIVIAIANPTARQRIAEQWQAKVPCQPVISPDVWLDPSVEIGKGVLICSGTRITVDVRLGNFVVVNLNTTVGHDVVIDDFCSLMPSVNVSGNVKVGKRVFIGTGATILQGLTIGDDVIIGAGALVTRSVPSGMLAVGLPAQFKSR